ncbi:thiamine biosynthesis lipoprotein [Nakamurella sp. UYEF19]|uniref:FAD:protein FMN transferase n=1 Tax=Nakamurella sp. UYEF19 TaxID=1756392 RepID=UPI003393C9E5
MTTTAVQRDGISPARYVEHVMGMPISLALRGRHTRDDVARSAWAQVMSELQTVDGIFSTYRPDSFVSRLRRDEITVQDCPPEVAEVLALGEAARIESRGAFDVHLPGPGGSTVLDPSGVVKGWAVERAAAVLRQLTDTDFCLSAGGDMTCRTADDTRPAWRIGIEDPADPARVLAVVPIRNGAVATSGTAHRGSHLIDPRTGGAPAGVASVTVITDSLTWADIDATAAYVHGANAARWLETRPGRTGFIVWSDGSTTNVVPR